MDEEKTLRDIVKELSDKYEELEKQQKIKRFRLPFRARLGKAKVKNNYVTIIFIQDNKAVKFMRAKIDEQVAEINGVPYYIPSDHIMNYKNKPLIILPSWSMSAFNPNEHYAQTLQNPQYSSKGWRYLMNYMNKTMIKAKKEFKIGAIIFVILIVGGIAWYAIKSGAFS